MTANLYSIRQSKIWAEMVEKENMTRLQWYENTKRRDVDMAGEPVLILST